MNRFFRFALALAVTLFALVAHDRKAHAVYCEPYPAGDASPTITLTGGTVAGRALSPTELAEYQGYAYSLLLEKLVDATADKRILVVDRTTGTARLVFQRNGEEVALDFTVPPPTPAE